MSKVIHRKPVWGWSVVLLSTLLLSPMAASVVLQALAHASSGPAEASATGGNRAGLLSDSARRADDEEALRAAARSGKAVTIRLDTDPDHVAIVFPSQTVLLVPDDAPRPLAPAAADSLPFPFFAATPSRAPPFVS